MATAPAARSDHGAAVVAKLLGGIALVGLGLVLITMLALAGLNTDPGRGFVARQLARIAPESGLTLSVGRLEGSLYGRLLIRDLRVSDPKGVFATSPLVVLDWRPTALLQNHVAVNELSAETVRVLRLPIFNETTTEGPILPNIDITVRRLNVDRIVLEPPVAGRRQVLALNGRAEIADRRAIVTANARATAGDRLTLKLDAVPDDNRFDIDADLSAPAGGVVAGLAGLDRPLTARVSGQGSWANWRGALQARLGGTPLADLGITGRDGLFTLAGEARPGLLLSGAPARLLSPTLNLRGTAALAERRADVALRATSAALDVAARGLVDLGAGRFGHLTVDARLLRPNALLDDTRGRDVRLALTLDGPFAEPFVDYRLTAGALAFGETGVEALRAEGRTRLARTGPILVPLTASAARVVGVNEAVGGVLRNLRVDGTLRVTPRQLLSDNLRIRSDRLAATAVLAVTFATGQYDVAFKGAINRYVLPGLGVVDLVTDARLAPTSAGAMGVRGNISAKARRIDNAGLRNLLGGLPTFSAAFERLPNGTIRFNRGRLSAPKLRIDDASGLYRADGTLVADARGRSADYGPFVVHADGPLARPAVRLRAASPNVGIPLTNVEAVLTPTRAGYAIVARGGSPYGPIALRARLALGGGPLALDIDSLQVAGITAKGRVTQTAAGPFAGRLLVSGSGISGTVQLAAAGAIQRVDAQLRANQARIALAEPLLIAQGEANVSALLYPNGPSVDGRASVQGLRWGELALTRADGRAALKAGVGTARVEAAGRSGAPFTLRAEAGLSPNRIRVAASGNISRVDLRLAQPAELVAVRGGWRLLPATVLVGTGRADVEGTFAGDTRVAARLVDLDLGITRAFAPQLRLGGKAGGNVSLLLPARGAPVIRAGVIVLRLTRSSLAGTSQPIDLALNTALSGGGGAARAVLRRGTDIVGRLEARLAPLPGNASDPALQRLLAAPFSGSFTYNGPAEALWALSGVTGHEVRGPLAIAARFGGRPSDLRLEGTARAQGLRYDNLAFGTVVRDINFDSRFNNGRFDLLSLTSTAGNGRVSAKGSAVLSADRGFPANIEAQFDNARLARRPDLSATVTGPVRLTSGPTGALVSGQLAIDTARYNLARSSGATDIPTIAVRRVPQPGAVPPRPARAAPPSAIRLDVKARANNDLRVEGMGLESEWRTNLQVGGTATDPRLAGNVSLIRGTFSFASNRFDLTRGIIRFNGSSPPNPTLDIVAETDADGVTAIINITGTSDQPQIAFSSTPALPQDEILSRLLFGSSVGELSAVQALQLASSVASLRGGGGGLNPLGKLRQASGFDRFRILGADKDEGRGTALAVGENLGDNIYVELTTDVRGYTATQVEIALTRALSLITQVGGSGGTNVSVKYGKDY